MAACLWPLAELASECKDAIAAPPGQMQTSPPRRATRAACLCCAGSLFKKTSLSWCRSSVQSSSLIEGLVGGLLGSASRSSWDVRQHSWDGCRRSTDEGKRAYRCHPLRQRGVHLWPHRRWHVESCSASCMPGTHSARVQSPVGHTEKGQMNFQVSPGGRA